MPIHYELDDVHRRVVVTAQGPFALEDFLAVIERRRTDNTGAYGILYDLCGMTGEPTIADLRQFMSAAAQTTRPRGPIALLASEPALYAKACTYADMGRSTALVIEAFHDPAEAEQWLTQAALKDTNDERSALLTCPKVTRRRVQKWREFSLVRNLDAADQPG
jgi:hypothetical protein